GQFQDRVVRRACRRVGWTHVGGLRRSVGGAQVLLDVAYIRDAGAPRRSRRGRRPGRARGNRLARRPERQVTSGGGRFPSPRTAGSWYENPVPRLEIASWIACTLLAVVAAAAPPSVIAADCPLPGTYAVTITGRL